MARYVNIRKVSQSDTIVLYYFTDYIPPCRKIVTPINKFVEGILIVDLVQKNVKVKEITEGLYGSKKEWILKKALMKVENALQSNQLLDNIDYIS